MIKKRGSILVATFFSILLAGNAFATTLPDPTTTINGTPVAVQYGDFYSYSLPILAYYDNLQFGGGVGPGNPFYIDSTPGAIKDDIVIATGASGTPVNTNFAGVENAYATPNGVSGSPIFSTRNSPDPGQVGPAFTGQQTGTWDAQFSALRGFLGTSDLVLFFNNNQTNSGSAADQNLFAWGQVELIDTTGVKSPLYFDFTNKNTSNNVALYNSPGHETDLYPYPGGPKVPYDFPTQSDFVLSGGQLFLDTVTGIVYTTFNKSILLATGDPFVTFDENLGANQAAYAIFSPELNAILKDPNSGYDVLRGDFRMTALNNGYEQLFVEGATVGGRILPPPIPEPCSLFLFGSGLVGLSVTGIRRKKALKVK